MELARRVARNVVYNLSAMAVGSASGLFLAVILARILRPEQFGIYSLALSIAMILTSLSSLGIEGAVIRYVAYYSGIGDVRRVRSHFRYFLKIRLVLSILISCSLIVLSKNLAVIFRREDLALPFAIAGLIVFFYSLTVFFDSFFRGIQRFEFSLLKQVVYEASRWAFVIPLSMIYLASGALLGYVISFFISSALLLFIILSKYTDFVIGDTSEVDRRVGAFIGFMTIAGITGIMYAYIDSVMIGYFLTPKDVGFYRAAFIIVFAIIEIVSSSSGVLFPAFTQLSMEDIRRALDRIMRYTSALTFPSVFIIIYLAGDIIRVVYGHDYMPSVKPMTVLAFALIPGAFGYLGTIFNAKERPDIYACIVAISMAINVFLNLFLIPSLGTTGAAVATVISRFFLIIAAIVFLCRILKIVPSFRSILKPLMSTLAMVSFIFAIPDEIISSHLKIAAASVIYLSLLFATRGLTAEDIRYLKAIVK